MDKKSKQTVHKSSSIWLSVYSEAKTLLKNQKEMSGLVSAYILQHDNLAAALAFILSKKLKTKYFSDKLIYSHAIKAYTREDLISAACYDLLAVKDRDPACTRLIQPLLYFKGFQAIQAYRLSNYLFKIGKVDFAYFLQMRVSEIFGVDIHPRATIGRGLMIDHAHSVVIGETAVVGENVSMLHSVTLGGTGKDVGNRHPKIGDGVLLGARASVLGNITIGRCSKVASGSVVLSSVPDCKTVAGVPARIVGESGCDQPSYSMDHKIS